MSVYRAVLAVRETLAAEMSRPDLSLCAVALWQNLAARVDQRGECFPCVDTLARSLGVKPATIRRARSELVDAGAILVEIRRGRGNTNLYRLPLQTVQLRSTGYPHTARQRAGSLSTYRAYHAHPALKPRVRRTENRALARDEVVPEVEGEKRSAAAQRRRVIFNIHRPDRRAS